MSLLPLGGLGDTRMPLEGLGAPSTPSGPAWSGWRLALTTDANGNLTPGQITFISSVVVGDSITISLSGPVTPSTTIASALLYLDTTAGVRVVSVGGVLTQDGSGGTYAVSFHVGNAQTALLVGGATYQWSVVLSAGADTWTPVNGATFYPRADRAV